MDAAVLYVHGKGGSAGEAEHYRPLFPGCEVVGLDYKGSTPWEAGPEIAEAVRAFVGSEKRVTLIANSIGAYFSMCAGVDGLIRKAYFISPIVDMEQLISDMMGWADVTEAELKEKGVIHTAFGEDLNWDYLRYVREHPVRWDAPTAILYGNMDHLTAYRTTKVFAERFAALLTVMEGGEHWFHTPEQMAFLDEWIRRSEANDRDQK